MDSLLSDVNGRLEEAMGSGDSVSSALFSFKNSCAMACAARQAQKAVKSSELDGGEKDMNP